jgi:hypothetical protein
MTLKNCCRTIKDKELGLPRFDEKVALLIKHFKALAPLQEEVDGKIQETISKTGDDHITHAVAYALLGFEKLEKGNAFSVSFCG